MPSSKKLPLDTRDTVHDQEADEREQYHATQRAYEKGHISKANDKKNAKARFDLFTELFDKKLKVNPKEKAKKLAFIVRDSDTRKSRVLPSDIPSMYSGRVVPFTNMGMICKLLEEILNSFQMKGKLRKVGGFASDHLLTEPEMAMKTLRKLMVYIVKNVPEDDAYVIVDNYMKLFLPVVQSLTGKLI